MEGPETPNQRNHEFGLRLKARITALIVKDPHWIAWGSNISNRVPVGLKDCNWQKTQLWIIFIIEIHSCEDIYDAEKYDPKYKECWEFLHIIDTNLKKSYKLPELLIYSQVEHDFKECKAYNHDWNEKVAYSKEALLLGL